MKNQFLLKLHQRKSFESQEEPAEENKVKQKIVKESQSEGDVTTDVYLTYLKAVKSSFVVCLVVFLFITAQAFYSGLNYFVSVW